MLTNMENQESSYCETTIPDLQTEDDFIDESEKQVIGTVLRQPDSLMKIDLKPEYFLYRAHRKIFSVMLQMYHSGEEIDVLSVGDELRKKDWLDGVGFEYLGDCMGCVISTANVEKHAKRIHEAYQRRTLRSLGVDNWNDTSKTPAIVAQDQINRLQDAIDNGCVDGMHSVGEGIETVGSLAEYERIVKTGYSSLDANTGGLCPGQMWLLGAAPGNGKTTFALNVAMNVAETGVPVLYYSSEMKLKKLQEKMISRYCGLTPKEIHNGHGDELHDFYEAREKVQKLPIIVDDYTQDIEEIYLRSNREIRKRKIGLVVIDYLQRYHFRSAKSRFEEVSKIARLTKDMAMRFDVPILGLAQINREARREDLEPDLHHLKDSGDLEQEADIVMFLWKEEFHDVMLKIAKNRPFGETGYIPLVFNEKVQGYRKAQS